MNPRKRPISVRLLSLLILLALPALACSTLVGDSDSNALAEVDSAVQSTDPGEASGSDDDTTQDDTSESGSEPATEPGEDSSGSTEAGAEESEDPAGSESSTTDDDSAGDSGASGESDDSGSSGDGGESSSQDSGPSGPDQDAQEALSQALVSGTEIDRLRVHVSGQQLEGFNGEVTIEVIRPDRFRLVADEIEMISIGDTVYMKAEGTEWVSIPSGTTSTIEPFLSSFGGGFTPFSSPEELITGLEDVTFLGSETLNGLETYVYDYGQDVSGSGITQSVKVWIGVADGLPYRQELIGSVSGQSINSVLEFEYGPDITIEPPI